MRKIKVGLLAMILGCGSSVCALAQEESVMVDLSVLEGLNSAPAAYAPTATEPLFPIVKKAPKAKKVSKPVVKKSKPVVKVEVKETKTAVAKEETPKAEEKVAIPQQIPFVESAEPVVVVDVEPTSEPKETATPEQQPSVAQTLPAAPAMAENAPAPAETAPKAEENPIQTEAKVEVAPAEAKAPALLVEDTPASVQLPSPQAVNNKLTFAADADELNDEQKKQIDGIIASFKDAKNNKIAIYAYNQEEGDDAFRRKRLSLNRAVEVRSYLLPKGYKNFSIKVINVDAASGKADTVEIEELEQ